jgi:hypothetical protein
MKLIVGLSVLCFSLVADAHFWPQPEPTCPDTDVRWCATATFCKSSVNALTPTNFQLVCSAGTSGAQGHPCAAVAGKMWHGSFAPLWVIGECTCPDGQTCEVTSETCWRSYCLQVKRYIDLQYFCVWYISDWFF